MIARCKLALTEDSPTIRPYDQAAWAELPDYRQTPIRVSLNLLEALHARWVTLLTSLTDEDFERSFIHPEMQDGRTLDWLVGMYGWHSRHHSAHITSLAERMGWQCSDSDLDLVTTGDYNFPMRSVGIKQLKARLSEYVRLARGGELILVSDRDEVVAELGPVRHRLPELGSVQDTLDRLARQGQVTRAGQPKQGWSWKPRGLGLSEDTVSGLLDELREDR